MTSESNNQTWRDAFIAAHKAEIWKRPANPFDPAHMPNCFGVGQHAAILAEGRLLYHEGTACDRYLPGSKPQRHAWNTLDGRIVDLSMNIEAVNYTLVDASEAYEKYEFEQTYTVDEVRERMALHPGVPDWFTKPEYANMKLLA
jgi:hypothetical protein